MSTEIRPPQVLTFAELEPSAADLIDVLVEYIFDSAIETEINTKHTTSRDERDFATLRRTSGLIDPHAFVEETAGAPKSAESLRRLYAATAEKVSEYLGREVKFAFREDAAVGHVYHPGNSHGEVHVDYSPSATAYLLCPGTGGELVVSKNPDAKSREEIMASDPFIIPIQEGTVAIFDGQMLPHFANGVPDTSGTPRISINFTYRDVHQPHRNIWDEVSSPTQHV